MLAGERLREARRAKRLTLRELADRLEIDFGFIGKVERGRGASIDTYKRIADALGLPLASLFAARKGVVRRPSRRPPQGPSNRSA